MFEYPIRESTLIRNLLLELPGKANPVPLTDMGEAILRKVTHCCEEYTSLDHYKFDREGAKIHILQDKTHEFMKMNKKDLFDLILAANDMGIDAVLDCSCKAAAGLIADSNLESLVGLPNELKVRVGEHLPL